ncbi:MULTISPECIES: hypothetical protein [Enterobacter cloacae complex]|uniref:hypothetical protein n=1 Tax=Enterobacter cloacae complex TaxID=354276 RepID=UPI00067FC88E|nr:MULTISPECIES: hypothetical protein [Enterobacter cloacae complex]MCQ4369993.1 hypothetical protein [Enterobacter asburiae]MDS1913332.1 hypothetical protein [Enterobacter asburiae]HDC4619816.1 hypothetical protein [Enterobacter asburiae]
MKLFIANCSRQAHTFNYKLPEKTQSFGVTIKAGQQHVIEQPQDIIEHIIRQHEPYGFQPKNKVDKDFSGLCYSIEKVVTSSEILENSEQKLENLDEMSQKILEASAISLNNAVDNAVIQSGETPLSDGIQMEIKGEAINQDQPNPAKVDKKVQVKK